MKHINKQWQNHIIQPVQVVAVCLSEFVSTPKIYNWLTHRVALIDSFTFLSIVWKESLNHVSFHTSFQWIPFTCVAKYAMTNANIAMSQRGMYPTPRLSNISGMWFDFLGTVSALAHSGGSEPPSHERIGKKKNKNNNKNTKGALCVIT